jgi:hypothetical protein
VLSIGFTSAEQEGIPEKIPGRRLASFPPYLSVPGVTSLQLCPGDTLEVSMCPIATGDEKSNVVCSGDPVLSLKDFSGNMVAINDNYCGSCPSLLFTADPGSDCETPYFLNASCASGSCSGTAGVRVTTTSCPYSAITTARHGESFFPTLDCSLVDLYKSSLCADPAFGDWFILTGGNYRNPCSLDGPGYGCNRNSSEPPRLLL